MNGLKSLILVQFCEGSQAYCLIVGLLTVQPQVFEITACNKIGLPSVWMLVNQLQLPCFNVFCIN